MKAAKLLFAAAVIFVSSSLLAGPPASAQILSDVWLKTRVLVKGYSVDPVSGDHTKYNKKQWIYISLASTGGGPVPLAAVEYNITSYAETTPGVWTVTDHGEFDTSPKSESFFPDVDLTLPGLGGSSISLAHTPHVKITLDKLGAIKHVLWRGRGEVYAGNDGTGRIIYGDVYVKGKEIDISRCPFIP
jgi:hypothetical protein